MRDRRGPASPTPFAGPARGLALTGVLSLLAAAALATPAAHAEGAPATQPIPYTALNAPALPDGDVEGELALAAKANGLDPALVHAVAVQESGLNHAARSRAGAMGVMQLTAATAKDLGVDPHDLHQNIQGGVAYLRTLILAFGGDVSKALAAYNAGPGAVQRFDGIPPFSETRKYVASIMAHAAAGAAEPLPAQAARAALAVASTVGRAATQRASQVAAAQLSVAPGVAAGADPIGDAIKAALR